MRKHFPRDQEQFMIITIVHNYTHHLNSTGDGRRMCSISPPPYFTADRVATAVLVASKAQAVTLTHHHFHICGWYSLQEGECLKTTSLSPDFMRSDVPSLFANSNDFWIVCICMFPVSWRVAIWILREVCFFAKAGNLHKEKKKENCTLIQIICAVSKAPNCWLQTLTFSKQRLIAGY